MFMFRPPLLMIVYVHFGQQCCVKNLFYNIFYFETEGSHSSEGAG